MARRCGPDGNCGPRTNWWKQSMGVDWYSGGGSNPPDPEELQFDSQAEQDLILFLNTARIKTMMLEGGQIVGDITPVAGVDGDAVGCFYGLDVGGSKLKTSSNTNRPTLGSGTVNSYLTSLSVPFVDYVGSTLRYKFIHALSPTCTIRFKMLMGAGTDGVQKILMYTNAATPSSANFGMHLERTTGNKFRLRVARGTSGTYMIDYTTTFTVNIAAGWITVQITLNGTGATAGTILMNDTSESFNVLSGVDNISSASLTLFTSTGVSYAHVQMYTRVVTAQEITDYKSFNPARDTTNWFQVPRWYIDFSDQTKLYSDAGATTNVNNGEDILVAKNSVTIPATYFNERRQTADTARPAWNSGVQNGLGAAQYTGSLSENMIFSQAILGEAPKGRWIMAIVLRNVDANNGSRFLQATAYAVVTGSNYNGVFTDPYMVMHGSGAASAAPILAKNLTDGWNLFIMMRDGGTLYTWNGLKQKASGAWSVDANYINMGVDGDASGWSMDGFIGEFKVWWGCAEDAYIEAEIDRLNVKWGI